MRRMNTDTPRGVVAAGLPLLVLLLAAAGIVEKWTCVSNTRSIEAVYLRGEAVDRAALSGAWVGGTAP